jgi:hypothetical protein
MKGRITLLLCLTLWACKSDKSSADSGSADAGDDTGSPIDYRIDGIFNEFLSSNDATNTDDDGEFDDWLEIANPTGNPLDLSGYGLTDGLAQDEAPWIIPNGTVVLPGKFLLIWCDEDEEQGSFHASFKLNADGETVSLIDTAGNLIDEVDVPGLSPDTSWARAMNGQWGEAAPTPDSPNP